MSNESLTEKLAELSVSWAAQSARMNLDADDLADELAQKIEDAPAHLNIAELRASYGWKIRNLRETAARHAARSDVADETGLLAIAGVDLASPEFMQEHGNLWNEAYKQGRTVRDDSLGADYLESEES